MPEAKQIGKYRKVHDSMGEMQVPVDALYGAQTQRAITNFQVSDLRMPRRFIEALGLIKHACAAANATMSKLPKPISQAIQRAALQVAAGKYDAHFPVDVFQTGSGTSSNMNANEVIAALASTPTRVVHPNDHVNMSQSSNDVIPTAIKISAVLDIQQTLRPALAHLTATIANKGKQYKNVIKTGRTHLMDAMPLSLQQEMSGWRAQLQDQDKAIQDALVRLAALPQGGTAVGTGINAEKGFSQQFVIALNRASNQQFTVMKNYFAGLGAQDAAVEMSGKLRGLAVVLMKIANDLRWMNSGPLAGLGEIELQALQPGSSIMPGKVNPVIPESVCMSAAQVIGNDTTIMLAGQSGNFQLNVMLPVIAYNLLQSTTLLGCACRLLADKAIATFHARTDKMRQPLERNPILITALNQMIGYEKGAAIAKRAYAENRPVLEVAKEMTDLSEEQLGQYLDPKRLI